MQNNTHNNLYSKTIVDKFPSTAWFALTGKCNIKCTHCPAIREAENNSDITDDLYDKFIDKILPKLNNLILGANNFGEQTLSKKIYDLIDKASKCNVKVKIWTNGTLLNDRLINKIIEKNTNVTISMEGVEENYENIRKASYVKIKQNIISLINKKKENNSDIKIEIAYTVIKDNLNDIYELIDFGFDMININYLIPINKEWEKNTFTQNEILELENTFFEDLKIYAHSKRVGITLKKSVTDVNSDVSILLCSDPWTKVNIRENGDVLPCCIAGDDMIMGNLSVSTFDDIWNSNKYKKLRQSIIDRKLIGTCRNCKGQYKKNITDIVKTNIKYVLIKMKLYKLLNILVESNRYIRRRY